MGVFNQLKQIKDLKKQAKEMQSQLGELEESADAGWSDKVKITMNGNQEVTKVEIDKGLLEKGDNEKLADLVKEAVNKTNKKVKKVMAKEMMKKQGGMSAMLKQMQNQDQ